MVMYEVHYFCIPSVPELATTEFSYTRFWPKWASMSLPLTIEVQYWMSWKLNLVIDCIKNHNSCNKMCLRTTYSTTWAYVIQAVKHCIPQFTIAGIHVQCTIWFILMLLLCYSRVWGFPRLPQWGGFSVRQPICLPLDTATYRTHTNLHLGTFHGHWVWLGLHWLTLNGLVGHSFIPSG